MCVCASSASGRARACYARRDYGRYEVYNSCCMRSSADAQERGSFLSILCKLLNDSFFRVKAATVPGRNLFRDQIADLGIWDISHHWFLFWLIIMAMADAHVNPCRGLQKKRKIQDLF